MLARDDRELFEKTMNVCLKQTWREQHMDLMDERILTGAVQVVRMRSKMKRMDEDECETL